MQLLTTLFLANGRLLTIQIQLLLRNYERNDCKWHGELIMGKSLNGTPVCTEFEPSMINLLMQVSAACF